MEEKVLRYYNDVKSIEIDSLTAKVIDLEFKEEEIIEIPTISGEYFQGELLNLDIIQHQNIVADLYYDGTIKCVDLEDNTLVKRIKDYLDINPVFHSENLTINEPGHYQFKTKHPGFWNLLMMPSFQQIKDNISKEIKSKYIIERELPEELEKSLKNKDSFFETLKKVNYFVNAIHSKNDRVKDFYDFNLLYDEYLTKGKFDGDCKSISVMTAGLLNSLGLPARMQSGFTKQKIKNKIVQIGHSWAETYIPKKDGESVWVPVDPAMGTIATYNPRTNYSYMQTALPIFLNKEIKTAKLKITYEKAD